MTTGDINRAFCILNTKPLYGYYPHNSPGFQGRVLPTQRQVNYFIEDSIALYRGRICPSLSRGWLTR